jgi:hypothetical protein
MHDQTFGYRSLIEHRDLSRAAAERYLMLQALADRQATPPDRHRAGSRRTLLRRLLNVAGPRA